MIPFFCCAICQDSHATTVCPRGVRVPVPARVFYDKAASVWVAHDSMRNIYSQGETEAEAREAIGGAIDMFDEYKRRRVR